MKKFFYVLKVFYEISFYLKYRRSYFGYLWGLMNPVFMITSTAFIFSSILHKNFSEYIFYVYAGMIPWLFISQTIFSSSNVYISYESLIRKVRINLVILPMANLLVVLFDSLITCLLYLMLSAIKNGQLNFSLIQLIPAYLIIVIFCSGCALIFSVLTVYFRDLQWLIQMGMQTLFFLTPVLYRPDTLTGAAKFIVELNPITPLIQIFSNILGLKSVEPYIWLSGFIVAFIVFLIGLGVYNLNKRKIIFRL